jgi:hypothetical protein
MARVHFILGGIIAVAFSSCAMFESSPKKQLMYAEEAVRAAFLAGAETNPATTTIFLMARDNLARARSYYRVKDFQNARLFANRARMAAEEAEWKSQKGVAPVGSTPPVEN